MGTPCGIGIVNSDGSINAVVCNYDGYPENAGSVLVNHYNDEASIREMLALGDMSSIDENIAKNVYYRRDRGEDEEGIDMKTYNTDKEFFAGVRDYGAQYFYLFKNGEWCFSKNGKEYSLNKYKKASNA